MVFMDVQMQVKYRYTTIFYIHLHFCVIFHILPIISAPTDYC